MCPSGRPLSCRSWRAADEIRILDRLVRAAFEVGDEQYRLPTRRALSGREPAPQDPHTKLPQKNGPTGTLGAQSGACRQRSTHRTPATSSPPLRGPSAGDPPTLRERPLMPAHHAEPPPPEVRRLEAVAAGTAHHSDLTPVGPEALNLRSYLSEPEPRRSDCPSTDLPPTPGTHTPLSISPQHVCGARGRPFQGRPGDLSHRPFAHLSEPEHLSCASSRRHERLHKPSGSSRHHLRIRTWITASNHRRITAPHTRTFNHGAALGPCSPPRAPLRSFCGVCVQLARPAAH